MRIAFLTHEPFYPSTGGGSIEAIYLVRAMAERGYQVDVYCPEFKEPEFLGKPPWAHVKFIKFSRWQMGRYTRLRNFKYLLFPAQLEKMVRHRARVEGIQYDWIWGQHSIACEAAGRLKKYFKRTQPGSKVRVAMNYLDLLTGFMESWPSWMAPSFWVQRLTKYEIRTPARYDADVVYTVSDELLDRFAEVGIPREKLHPFYFGIDAQLFKNVDWSPQSEMNEAPEIVMHGSFDHHHLGELALESTLTTLKRHEGVRFVFIGNATSAWSDFVQKLKDRGADMKRVCREDFIPYTDLPKRLSQSNIGWVPYEPTSGTHSAFIAKFVEYLSIGMPTVSGKLRGVSRYFEKTRLALFTDFTGESMADAFERIMKQTANQWKELGAESREQTLRELDWKLLSNRALDFLETRSGIIE